MNDTKPIYEEFISGLEKSYLHSDEELKEEFEKFIIERQGITDEELNVLITEFPDLPNSLIQLLKYSNGTDIYFFQSDVDDGKYPYYLVSSKEMLETKDDPKKYYSDFITRDIEEIEVDERITYDVNNVKWLLFSNCMNGGGTSQLFIDFTPSPQGKVGQIVRYLHDPDSIIVIADTFDEFLQQIIDSKYTFIDSQVETNPWLKDNKSLNITNKDKSKNNIIFIIIAMIIIGVLIAIFLTI